MRNDTAPALLSWLALAAVAWPAAPPAPGRPSLEREANVLASQGVRSFVAGRVVEARRAFEKALPLVRALHSDRPHRQTAALHLNVGECLALEGDGPAALTQLGEGCRVARLALAASPRSAPDARRCADCLIGLAGQHRALGGLAEMLDLAEEAEAALSAAGLAGSPAAAKVHLDLGRSWMALGDYRQARRRLERACELAGDDGLLRLRAMRLLAETLLLLNLREGADVLGRAGRLIDDARAASEAGGAAGAGMPCEIEQGLILFAEGKLLLQRGEAGEALDAMLRARGLLAKLAGSHPAALDPLASADHGVAAAALQSGDGAAAERHARAACSAYLRLGVDPTRRASALGSLGAALLALGKDREAAEELGRGLDLAEEALTRAAPHIGDRERLLFIGRHRITVALWLHAALRTGASPGSVYRRVLAWKGRTAYRHPLALAARSRPELRPLLRQHFAACQDVAFWAASEAAGGEAAVRLRAARDDLARAERALAKRLEREAAGEGTVTPEGIAAALPEGAAVVDYVSCISVAAGRPRPGVWEAEEALVAFVLRKGAPVACVRLPGTQAVLARHVTSWRRLLTAREAGDWPALLNAEARRIADVVWAPLGPALANSRRIVACPDGPLHRFPLSALPGQGPRTYLIDDGVAVSYAVSGREAWAGLSAPPAPAGRGALVMAGVGYGAARGPGGLDDLSHTLSFGEGVAQRFRRSHPGEDVALLSKKGASRRAFLDQAQKGPRVISLAAHGSAESAPEGAAGLAHRISGLLPSGLDGLLGVRLFFAGANEEPHPGGASLSGLEFASLDLSPVSLLLLCGCQFAEGAAEAGEGSMSYIRAAHLAGVRTVAGSLWSESSEHATRLGDGFLDSLWGEGRPGAAWALREAQIKHRDQGGQNSHPRHWAGWVVSGDAGGAEAPPPDSPPVVDRGAAGWLTFGRTALAALVTLAVGLAGAWLVRRSRTSRTR